MKYENVVSGIFLSRPNRFIAKVLIGGKEEIVHVKNTGRCRELLTEGSIVYLSVSDRESRKTKYDLIAVEKKRQNRAPLLVNIDSQIPNGAVMEWLKKGNLFSENAVVRREVTYGASRFDFFAEDDERKAFLEVKGVTMEKNGVALFPDAPTERGIKHLNELVASLEKGYEAYVIFVIQMKEIFRFSPNDKTHLAFGNALRRASAAGVRILAYDCVVTTDSIALDAAVEVDLLCSKGEIL